MPRKASSSGSPNSAACPTRWEKKRARRPGIDDHSARVPLGHPPPHPFHLPAETQFVAQPDRNLFRYPPTQVPPRRQFHLGVRTRVSASTVHHLLQHHDGPPIQLDLFRQTSAKKPPASLRPAPPPHQNARTTQITKPCHLMKPRLRVVALDSPVVPQVAENQRGVVSAETKAVRHDRRQLPLAGLVGRVVEIASRIGIVVVDRGRNDAVAQRQDRKDELHPPA